ncbi:hypothetical protein GCM10009001_07370 [Virgibacillus siamensis]|uniref:Protein YoqH n=1 Tax=Virgibacillus siamensis TaxID=480071 RepID=A0ABN1FM51_9BACI
MKQFILVLLLLCSVISSPSQIKADPEISMPCSLVLNSVNSNYDNAKGVALAYKVKLTPSFPRKSISIHALHIPEPSTFGNYDTYEGFAFIPDEISWRFKLYPTTEEGGPTWAGRIDGITEELKGVTVQVRPSNSKTEKLGSAILTNDIKYCK